MTHIQRAWVDKGQRPALSPTTSMGLSNMEHLTMALPVWFQEHLGALRGTVLTGTRRESDAIANAGVRPLRPSCCQLFQATRWWSSGKPSRWCYSALPNLGTKQVRLHRFLTLLLYQALTLSCHKATAETTVFILWMWSALHPDLWL